MPTIYTFQAKSIQSHILDSNRLKDIVGASEQIENLCAKNGLLDDVLAVLELKGDFFRRAGGEFTIKFETEENAKRFQSVWSYCIRQQVPGLSFIQNTYSYSENDITAFETLKKRNEPISNRLLVDFPVAGPLIARSRRTGGAAVKRTDEETLDAVTHCKREFYKRQLLLKKVDPEDQFYWPTYFSGEEADLSGDKEFPLLLDNNYIGIIHADGNGLGVVLKKAMQNVPPERYQTASYDFSKNLEEATLKATRFAIREKLSKYAVKGRDMVMPARPLVVGGDDLTFIVRGDLALPFTETFLEEFEKETEKNFDELRKKYSEISLPSHLTACAGIAFVKAKQPFYQAYNLAKSLCKHAKKAAREFKDGDELMPSALAFHRITTSLIDRYEDILKRELTIETDNKKIVLSMQPYFLGKVRTNLIPRFSQLGELAELLKNRIVSRGAIRELFDLLYLDRALAKQRFDRWEENLRQRDPKLAKDILESFKGMVGQDHPDLPRLLKKPDKKKPDNEPEESYSPLGDALALGSICRGSENE